MNQNMPPDRAGPIGFARLVIEVWALGGGVLLLALVLMTTWSVTASWLLGAPVAGDFEITEIGVAVAAFSFLPYCQLTHANVSADIFTARLNPRPVALLTLLGAGVAFLFSLLLLWRMWAGLGDYREYLEVTAILGFPIWIAYLPILFSLALLAVAAGLSIAEAGRDVAKTSTPPEQIAGGN